MYARNNPWNSYKKVATTTASPGQLVLMLFDGALRFIDQALAGFDHDDPLEFNVTIHNNITKTQAIINELNLALDMQRGGRFSETMRSLYLYMDAKLTDSNVHKTQEGILEVRKYIAELRDAWSEMLANGGNSTAAPENVLAGFEASRQPASVAA